MVGVKSSLKCICNPICFLGFPSSSDGKASACKSGDLGLIPGREDPLEEGMATHSSTLAWKIPWMDKEPGRLQSMGSQRVRHDWATSLDLLFMTHRSACYIVLPTWISSFVGIQVYELIFKLHLINHGGRWTFIASHQTRSQPCVLLSLSVDKLLSSTMLWSSSRQCAPALFCTHSSPCWRVISLPCQLSPFTLYPVTISSPPRYGAGVPFSEKLPFFPRWSFPLGLLCMSYCIIIVCISCIYCCLKGSMSNLFLNKAHSMC